jgi:hypothetical protein
MIFTAQGACSGPASGYSSIATTSIYARAAIRRCDDIGGGLVFERGRVDGRFFVFDVWDWSMMVGGSLLIGLVALLG